MGQSKNIDKISQDILNDDFIRIFKPILFVQYLFGMCGVHIKLKYVTPPTRLYMAYNFLIWTMNFIALFNCIMNCKSKYDLMSTDIPMKIGVFLNGAINAVLAWKTVVLNGKNSSQMYVTLQKIDRGLNLRHSKKLNEYLFKISLAGTTVAIILAVSWMYTFCFYIIQGFHLSAYFMALMGASDYFDFSLYFVILYYIRLRAKYINEVLKNNANQKNMKKPNIIGTNLIVDKELVPEEIIKGMYCVLDSFDKVMDGFQFGILFFASKVLGWQLITIQNFVSSIKLQISANNSYALSSLPYCFIYMFLVLLLCLVTQSLTSKLEDSKNICKSLTLTLHEGKSRDNAKRLILLVNGIREATVFDMFTLNNRLPLQLVAITASYTIVLLQFAVI